MNEKTEGEEANNLTDKENKIVKAIKEIINEKKSPSYYEIENRVKINRMDFYKTLNKLVKEGILREIDTGLDALFLPKGVATEEELKKITQEIIKFQDIETKVNLSIIVGEKYVTITGENKDLREIEIERIEEFGFYNLDDKVEITFGFGSLSIDKKDFEEALRRYSKINQIVKDWKEGNISKIIDK